MYSNRRFTKHDDWWKTKRVSGWMWQNNLRLWREKTRWNEYIQEMFDDEKNTERATKDEVICAVKSEKSIKHIIISKSYIQRWLKTEKNQTNWADYKFCPRMKDRTQAIVTCVQRWKTFVCSFGILSISIALTSDQIFNSIFMQNNSVFTA